MLSALLTNYKLVITVVKKGLGRKVVEAAREAGAEGGTTLFGTGTGIHEKESFLGIPIAPEKEIILTLICAEKADAVLASICGACHVDRPAHGIAIVVDVPSVAGICHLCTLPAATEREEGGSEMKEAAALYDLIVTIVNKGDAEKVVEASRRAGASGGTIMFGRGTGIHERLKLFGITIEPEKEIVLTLIDQEHTDPVLEAIIQEVELNKPGKGIAFVLKVEKVAGITHIQQLATK